MFPKLLQSVYIIFNMYCPKLDRVKALIEAKYKISTALFDRNQIKPGTSASKNITVNPLNWRETNIFLSAAVLNQEYNLQQKYMWF